MIKFNFYKGTIVSSWLLFAMIVIAELYEPFKSLLKDTFSHHWIGKAAIVLVAFVLFSISRKQANSKLEKYALYSVAGGMAAILLFYIAMYLLE